MRICSWREIDVEAELNEAGLTDCETCDRNDKPADPPDGTKLVRGIVINRAGGYNVAAYRCVECGRSQPAFCPEFCYISGLGEEAAERFGWRCVSGEWHCPFCCGTDSALDVVWEKGDAL